MDVMPWGKWRGYPLTEIPPSYLCWVLENCQDAGVFLRRAVLKELTRRFAVPATESGSQVSDFVQGVVRDWYRELAKKFHPDREGDTRAFQVLNEANARLREMLANPPMN